MTSPRYYYSKLFAAALVSALVLLGCKPEEQASALVGGYTFSRDFEGERLVLRIDPTPEQMAECMETSLPAGSNAPWKQADLDPSLHRSLIDLVFDEARIPQYAADTKALEIAGTFICTPRPTEPDFCYVPQVVVTGSDAPWRFGLQSSVPVSDEGKELIDEFLTAHEACWDAGTSMQP